MRILVTSDIHSNFPALESVLRDVGNYDIALCAGDIVGYGPYPLECVETLFFKDFRCVKGNHDHAVATIETDWFNDDAQDAIRINRGMLSETWRNWVNGLPLSLNFVLNGVRLSIFHGSPIQPLKRYIYEDEARMAANDLLELTQSDIIILGHTHIPYIVETNGRYLLNPGSVGQPRDGDPKSSYMILNMNPISVEVRRIKYNIDSVVGEIDLRGIPHRFGTRLYRGF